MGLFLSVCLSLYSVDSFWALICWFVTLIRLTAFLLFLSPFPGLWTVCRCQLRLSPHTPKSAQICLRWLNRRKTAPVAFPARTTMPSGKLWTSSEFPEGCSAHLELRAESGELRGMITLWAENREDSTQQRLPLKLEKKSVKIRDICVTLWIENYKIGVNLCNPWANVKKNKIIYRDPPKIVPKTLAYYRKNE